MIDPTDRRTDGQTDTNLMHRRLTLKAASINKYLRQKLQKKYLLAHNKTSIGLYTPLK